MLQEKKYNEEPKLNLNEQEAEENTKHSSTQHAKNTVFWSDKQYSDIVFYLFIAILLLELVVAGVAFFYGIIHAIPDPNGGPPRFQFPWLAYVLAAILTPAALLLILQVSGFDVFHTKQKQDKDDDAWQAELPTRLRKAYIIIKNAPTIVLLLGILLLGAALVYVDGALNALFALSSEVTQYLPWIIGAVLVLWCVNFLGRMWFAYRTRRLEEEYAFRREIFERTGQIIVERGAMQLPPSEQQIQALEASTVDTIPIEQSSDVEIIDIPHEKK